MIFDTSTLFGIMQMFKLIILLCIVATTSGFISNAGGSVNKIPLAYPSTRMNNDDDGYALLSSINDGDDIDIISRRAVLHGTIVVLSTVWASQAQAAKLRPNDAYANLVRFVLYHDSIYLIAFANHLY